MIGIINMIAKKVLIKKIIKEAIKSGCDIDGDVVYYKDKKYYVNVLSNIVREI